MASCIREALEEREKASLAPWATFSNLTRGRAIPEEEDAYRTCFQRDRDRILHSKAFRRLKRKTQVFLAPRGDHYRTRLTHTLEVAQIARTVARALFLNEDLAEAIALGHDLGHTPFGHAGEAVLNEVCPGGFRHFEQSLRVVDLLEPRGHVLGLNLTWEVRDGILHHSQGKSRLRGQPAPGPNTPEGVIVSLADAVAYINHDIDDAVRAGVITLSDLPQAALHALGMTSSERIHSMVVGMIEGSQEGRIGVRSDVLEPMNALRDFLYKHVYPHPVLESEIAKAKKLLRELYDHLLENPPDDLVRLEGESIERAVVDFLAGMTDDYVLALYESRLMPRRWGA